MDEPFQRGELVTLRQFESAAEPLGRILSVTPEGDRAEVAWYKRAGHALAAHIQLNLASKYLFLLDKY